MAGRVVLLALTALAVLSAQAAAEDRRIKHRLAAEETHVKEETSAARLVAAKQASSFDSEMSKLNAELFPKERKAVWHHKSPAEIRKHWSDVSVATMGKGGDELSRRASFARSPTAKPAAGKAAVRANQAVHKREALSAAQAAADEIEHIKAVTEAVFPTMKKAADKTQTAAELLAARKTETNNVFPKRFEKQEAQGKNLMAKKLARVQQAQSELYGMLQARSSHAGVIKEADRVAVVQHRMAQQEKRARHAVQKQKALAQQHRGAAALGAKHGKGVAKHGKAVGSNWLLRKMQHEGRKNGQPAAAGGKRTQPKAPMGRKPISSDFDVPQDGTNVAFRGASQAGDAWFHSHPAKGASESVKKDDSKH